MNENDLYSAHQTVPFLIADLSKRYGVARVHRVVGSIVFCEARSRVAEATDELIKLHPEGAIVLHANTMAGGGQGFWIRVPSLRIGITEAPCPFSACPGVSYTDQLQDGSHSIASEGDVQQLQHRVGVASDDALVVRTKRATGLTVAFLIPVLHLVPQFAVRERALATDQAGSIVSPKSPTFIVGILAHVHGRILQLCPRSGTWRTLEEVPWIMD
eukprot:Skav212321  [mRNA]  locus=scaffold3374:158184:159268:+ [translate_table: standard]